MTQTAEMTMMNLHNPYQEKFREQLPLLLKDLEASPGGLMASSGDASAAGEPYVDVVPQWWGLVFVLSNQAAMDLATGTATVAAIGGLIAAICSVNPAIALGAAVAAAVIGLYSAVYGTMNRGNGIYITALWGVVAVPPMWIPTPR
jgi:hypothetical protein